MMREGNELEALGMKFLRLMGALRVRFARDLARYGLTLPQFMALLSLEKVEGLCRMGPLALSALQSLPSMTGVVDRLEEKGLVERQRDPKDRRSVVVILTKKGESLLSQIKAERNRTLQEILKGLSPEEVASLNSILEKLIQALESAEKEVLDA
jgi:DNA-binding MarR family transcriptional regulator